MDGQQQKEENENASKGVGYWMAKFLELQERMEIQSLTKSEEEALPPSRDEVGSETDDVSRLKEQLKKKDDAILALRKQLAVKSTRIKTLLDFSKSIHENTGALLVKCQQLKDQLNSTKNKKNLMEKELREEIAGLMTILRLQSIVRNTEEQSGNQLDVPSGSEPIADNPMGEINWNSVTGMELPQEEIYEFLGFVPTTDQGCNEAESGGETEIAAKRPKLNLDYTVEEGSQASVSQEHENSTGSVDAYVPHLQLGMNTLGTGWDQMPDLMGVSNVMSAMADDVTSQTPGSVDDFLGEAKLVVHTRDLRQLGAFVCICGAKFKTVGGLERHVARFEDK